MAHTTAHTIAASLLNRMFLKTLHFMGGVQLCKALLHKMHLPGVAAPIVDFLLLGALREREREREREVISELRVLGAAYASIPYLFFGWVRMILRNMACGCSYSKTFNK